MLAEDLGWFKFGGSRGNYYFHNGIWFWNQTESGGFLGVVMAFPDEIDAVLLTNTWNNNQFEVVNILAKSYEAAF